MDGMTQVHMREEAGHRGLIVYGTSGDLNDRLRKDSKRGVFQGNLQTMNDGSDEPSTNATRVRNF